MAAIEGKILDAGEDKRAGARVLLSMSGGVDSAASAVVLQQAGFRVVGMTMKNFCYGDAEVPGRSCCSIEAIEDAKAVCDRLGISHMVTDTEELFGREVFDDFVSEYAAARTPNPCVRCNTIVRFRTLLDYADRLDADYIATGHYARIFRSAADRLYLARSQHAAKDQSYFLSGLRHGDLRRVIFPLGAFTKAEVRRAARAADLDVADKPESQEVCFVPEGTLRQFLDGKIPLEPGPIEDVDGNVLGRHEGLRTYTVGQRRGLGVATGKPMYVVKLDTERNVLVLGDDRTLLRRELTCTLNWLDAACLDEEAGLRAQIRSRGDAEPVERIKVGDGSARVTFAEPQRAITPGQTIAFYLGDVVVGSGVIDAAGAS